MVTPEVILNTRTDSSAVFSGLKRRYVLAYLVNHIGSLSKDHVTLMADQLYLDSTNTRIRPLGAVAQHIGLPVRKDSVLDNVTLKYSAYEMEQTYSITPRKASEPSRGLIDALAGSGPTRPLLEELYSLEGFYYLAMHVADNQQIFVPLQRAKDHSEALRIIFDRNEDQLRKAHALVSVGPRRSIVQPL